MSVFSFIARLALRPVKPLSRVALASAGAALVSDAAEAVAGQLSERFRDPGGRLLRALERSHDRAWRAVEVALAGPSLWAWLDSKETREVRRVVSEFLQTVEGGDFSHFPPDFRTRCVKEIQAARAAGLLQAHPPSGDFSAQLAHDLQRLADPQALVAADRETLLDLAGLFREHRHPHVADLLSRPASGDASILVVAARYFFRRETETDPELFRGLTVSYLETLDARQRAGFDALAQGLDTHGAILEQMLGDLGAVRRDVGELLTEVRELRAEVRLQSSLKPRDSLSIHDQRERQLIERVLARYRALPEEQRNDAGLLNDLGVLAVGIGAFDEAQPLFRSAGAVAPDDAARATAHFNSYRTALERHDWPEALAALLEAARLDPRRYTPFPLKKYRPKTLLGAGAFGVVFRCLDTHIGEDVVIKALQADVLDRPAADIFREARALVRLRHDAIIHLSHCDFADEDETRPYLVMECFEGVTLEEHVRRHGRLPVAELLPLARVIGAALAASHQQGILHRDLKPANILVSAECGAQSAEREEQTVSSSRSALRAPRSSAATLKIIDFGLALKVDGGSSTWRGMSRQKTLMGSGIAGTFDYSAPEQMGELPGTAVGPHSDVYAFGRVCYFALFGTPAPDDDDKDTLPPDLKRLLGRCTARDVGKRPKTFAEVLDLLIPTATIPTLAPAEPAPAQGVEQDFRDYQSILLRDTGVSVYFQGIDPTRIKGWRQAADAGSARARVLLGEWLDRKQPAECAAAIQLFRHAADQGEPAAFFSLALMYEAGRGVKQDEKQALEWFRRAGEQGDASALYNLSLRYDNGRGVEKDEGQAFQFCRRAAEAGRVAAQCNLGWMYANGRGVSLDNALAVHWYRRAAEQGYATAQRNLAVRYDNGSGVEKNDALAAHWYRKAAEQGNTDAQCNLGWAYANGQGVEKNDELALAWYRKAADQGHAQAQFNLGVRYSNGRGVAKDDVAAVEWYRKSADQGYAGAQYNLALMYERGTGVARDMVKAKELYNKAAVQGDDDAKKALQRLK